MNTNHNRRSLPNPFSLAFGKSPTHLIHRLEQSELVINDFESDMPTSQVYMITGARGSGKTVLLTEFEKIFVPKKEWIVISLNPAGNLLNGMAAKLYSRPSLQSLFKKLELNFSVLGMLSSSVKDKEPIVDIESSIELMLDEIKKKNKKVLITIDEVLKTENIEVFALAFQMFLRHDYPVYLLMTGLFDNIRAIQDEKTLTFLYRAPRIDLEPLSMPAICNVYETTLGVGHKTALDMAKTTKGYSYAFQTLGYLYWEYKPNDYRKLLPEFDNRMSSYVYDKIWNERTPIEKRILFAVAEGKTRVKDIREECKMDPNEFTVYRRRLLNNGILESKDRGFLSFKLPRFDHFIQMYYAE